MNELPLTHLLHIRVALAVGGNFGAERALRRSRFGKGLRVGELPDLL